MIQTEFYNYQSNPVGLDWDKEPYESCNPAPQSLRTFLEDTYGGQYLGCHGDRPIVGGTSQSTHGFGAAFDWRYENPGPGLYVVDTEIIPLLIATSKETGLQAIHHYKRSLIWRPPGTSGRPLDSDGWKVQPTGSQMGQSWAVWLHCEFHPDFLSDGRSFQDKVNGVNLPPVGNPTPPIVVPPVTPKPIIPGAVTMIEVEVTTVRRGSVGIPVKRMQSTLKDMWNQTVTVDGNFGPQSEQALKNVQAFMGLTVDGVCGPKTWDCILTFPSV